MIFGQIDVFYILVEFEVDGMRPNESTKNRQTGAHGLNWKIFVNLKVIFEIWEEITHPILTWQNEGHFRREIGGLLKALSIWDAHKMPINKNLTVKTQVFQIISDYDSETVSQNISIWPQGGAKATERLWRDIFPSKGYSRWFEC